MSQLEFLHEFHTSHGGRISSGTFATVVTDYGDRRAEHAALRENVALLDLSWRSRLCLSGADRTTFLHGQVTNNVKDLKPGQGCYAALVSAKGKMESDAWIYCLDGEILIDFEPGLQRKVQERLERYIIAEDVQVVDVRPLYGLLSVQGPRSSLLAESLGTSVRIPPSENSFIKIGHDALGELYLMNRPRTGSQGFDLFVPADQLRAAAEVLLAAAVLAGGRLCGWEALELARIEAGIPRYGMDMDETTLPPETMVAGDMISYAKGCYIGQEILSRIRTYGQVAKSMRALRCAPSLKQPPAHGSKLYRADREAGYITSACASPVFGNIALGYVRRESNDIGTELTLRTEQGDSPVTIVALPFSPL